MTFLIVGMTSLYSAVTIAYAADDDGIWVNNVLVTNENSSNILGDGTASYNIEPAYVEAVIAEKDNPKPEPDPKPEPEPELVVDTVAMYRLYNPNSGEHFYTGDVAERDTVIAAGWNDEGTGWTAPCESATPVFRLYNANAGEHHYTTDASERDALITAGWNEEGTGWYSDDAHSVPLMREYNPNQFANNHNFTADTSEHEYLVSIGWLDEGVAWYGVAAE